MFRFWGILFGVVLLLELVLFAVSPYVKRKHVDHSVFGFESVLGFVSIFGGRDSALGIGLGSALGCERSGLGGSALG